MLIFRCCSFLFFIARVHRWEVHRVAVDLRISLTSTIRFVVYIQYLKFGMLVVSLNGIGRAKNEARMRYKKIIRVPFNAFPIHFRSRYWPFWLSNNCNLFDHSWLDLVCLQNVLFFLQPSIFWIVWIEYAVLHQLKMLPGYSQYLINNVLQVSISGWAKNLKNWRWY